ncbi:MAG: tetratricopeptide repeat protein [Deltaproteobacteria bacterium]|nr:tetratricopeptide repeat protein [Deltaproteobacteria bacterium]
MELLQEILQGELERLFSLAEIQALVRDYLGMTPGDVADERAGKATFVRRLLAWADEQSATPALADVVLALKGAAVDPRLRQNRGRRPPEELEPGTKLGAFTIEQAIGAGGVSLFYKAQGPDGPVGLRVLRREHAHDPAALHRYLAAQRLIRTVEHAALPKILEVGRADGRVFLATAWIPGKTARSLLADGPARFVALRPILTPVFGALGALHARSLVHGDVKVENVILWEEGAEQRVVLVGAGADRLGGRGAGGLEEAGRLAGFGTPKAVPPEQVRGATLDARADIYAVGVMLHELLTGQPPFVEKTAVDVCVRHLTAEPEPPSARNPRATLSKRIDALVLRCLRKDPAARFATVEQLQAEFESIQREEREAEERRAEVRSATVDEVQDWADQYMADPEDDALFQELEATARGAKAWDPVLQALQVVLDDATPERKKQTLFRMGRIYEAELKDLEQAEATYRSILEADPDDEMAVVAIEDMHRSAGQFDKLVDQRRERAAEAKSDGDRRDALLEAARVYETELSDYGKALAVVLGVFKEHPADDALYARIERLGVLAEAWTAVIEEVGGLLGATQDPATVVKLCTHLGSWSHEHLGRPDFGLRYHQQALQINPQSEDALDGIERIYRSAKQWPELVQVLERRAEVAAFPTVRRDRRAEAAAIYEERLGQPDKAMELYRSVLDEDATHAQAGAALERLYTKSERWDDLVALLDKRLAAATDAKVRRDTLLSIAEIREDRLERLEAAAEAFRAVIELDPDNLDALKGLERLYARRDQFKELLGVLERQLGLVTTPRQKVALLERVAALQEEEFMDVAAAIATFEKILDVDRDHPNALSALNRLYRSDKRWSQLVEVLEHQAELATERAEKMLHLRAQADVLTNSLELWGPALDVLDKVVELAPDDRAVLRELVVCARKTAQHQRVAGALRKLADLTGDGVEKGKILVELGTLQDDELKDHAAALDAYRAALDADRNNAAAASALRDAYLDKGDHTAAIEMLQREIDATSGTLAKAELLARMGRIYRRQVGDRDKALDCFEKAFALDSTMVEAAEPLAEIYREVERWADASRIYEQFSASADALGTRSAADLFLRQGEAACRLGDLDRADKAFAKALQLTPGDVAVHRQSAQCKLDLKRFEEARTLLQELLLRFGADMPSEERMRVHLQLALALQGLKDQAGVVAAADDVLKLDPGNREALRLRAAADEELGRWAEVVADLRKLMEAAEDEERFELLVRAGDILREKLSDNEKAAKSYNAALEIRPEHRTLLHKLIAVYQATEQWSRVVEAILRIADLLDDKKMLSKYYLTAARVNADKLGRTDEAVTYYDLALDNDPDVLTVFEEMVRILTDKQNWNDLERAYRKMIGRLEKGGDVVVRANLWHSLGEICQHRLNHMGDAISAYETALRLDPENRPWMEVLARLYGDDARHADKATRLHRQLLDLNPYRAESYQLLARIHATRERWDEAWCFSAALHSLGLAEDAEKEIYENYREEQLPQTGDGLSEEMWRRHMYHESLDEMITGIFATLQPAYLKRYAKTLKALGLADAEKLDVEKKDERLTWAIAEVSRNLGLEPPALVFHPDRVGTLALLDTDPPTLLAGKTIREMAEHEMADLKVVAFLAGRALAYNRPGFYMRYALQSGTALSTWFLAGVRRIMTNFPIPPNLAQPVSDAVEVLWRQLDRPATDKLGDQVASFLSAVGGGLDLKRWGYAVDLTTDRAGFFACNDIDIASKTVKSSPAESWMAPIKDRLRELILYGVSESYFVLREKTGLRIVVDADAAAEG